MITTIIWIKIFTESELDHCALANIDVDVVRV